MDTSAVLMQYFQTLLQALGPSHWWPAQSSFEVCLGAVLTQNTTWKNASRAIANLQARDLVHPRHLDRLSAEEIAEFIRPAGYFRVKAKRLKALLAFLSQEVDYDLDLLARQPTYELRPKLLGVSGVGPETADSILLYALGHEVFVVDAYTARIMNRHALVPQDVGYAELQELFSLHLPSDAALFQEYHALLVRAGKAWCKKSWPQCSACPLAAYLA